LTNSKKILSIFIFFSALSADSLVIIAVGDIMMGSTYPEVYLPPNEGKDLLKGVDPVLKSADLAIGNLEGPLLIGGTCTKKIEKGRCYAFRTPPKFARFLSDASFDFLNFANNHTHDFGQEGIASTIRAVIDVGIKIGGQDYSIGRFEIRNRKLAIVSFAIAPNTYSLFEIEKAQSIVANESQQNDIVIVSFHGGGEGVRYLHAKDTFEYFLDWPRGNVVKFSHAVIDSGADFVWGHGPHVPRAIEIYKDRIIAYSLGNFCTWGFNLDDERGYAPILKVILDTSGIFQYGEIISAIQKTFQYPALDPQHNAAKLMKKLSWEDFPNSSPIFTENYKILPRMQE